MHCHRYGCLLVLALSGLAGCATVSSTHSARFEASAMPAGESWRGVYFHPVFGYLHLVDENGAVVGRWRRADQSAWGELSGHVSGNTLHFQWREHKIGLVGPSAESHGRGAFQYVVGRNGIAELNGAYGLIDDEAGGDWHSIKQQRMKPDLAAIKGDTEALSPGKWE